MESTEQTYKEESIVRFKRLLLEEFQHIHWLKWEEKNISSHYKMGKFHRILNYTA